MKLNLYDAPHIRHHQNTRSVMLDAVLALLFLYANGVYYFGPRAIAMGICGVVASLVTDVLCTILRGKRANLRDFSAVVTGMLLPLMMPATISYTVIVSACVFAIVVAKHPFGGVGNNIFNPAAAGFSFAAICYGQALFTYPAEASWLPVFGPVAAVSGASPAFTLRLGGVPGYDTMELLLGKYPGPLGATNILVVVACLLYLVFRGTVRWSMPVSFFTTVSLFALLFPRSGTAGFASVGYELAAGLLLLGGVFFLGDPVTTPKREMAKIAYGIVAGILVMLFRRFGNMEEGITFAMLLMNASVWGADMLGERVASMLRRRKEA